MFLSIYTLKNVLFEGEVEKVIAQTPEGEISVLANHLPLISMLEGPAVRLIDKQGKEEKIKIKSGFIEIQPQSQVVILAEQ